MIHTSKECNDLIDFIHLHAFFYKQHFYKQHQAEIDKCQAKAKQHLEAELLLFENVLLHPRYHPKVIKDIIKNLQKTSTSV